MTDDSTTDTGDALSGEDREWMDAALGPPRASKYHYHVVAHNGVQVDIMSDPLPSWKALKALDYLAEWGINAKHFYLEACANEH